MDFNRIEILRKELKLTQEEIARDAGISTAGYQQMIYKKNTTVSTLEKISKALKVSPAFWWSEETEMKNLSDEITKVIDGLQTEIGLLKAEHDISQSLIKNLNDYIAILQKRIPKDQFVRKNGRLVSDPT